MAFNPFHAFRKHQKVVFAGLTIICMLTFVLALAFILLAGLVTRPWRWGRLVEGA